MKKYLLGTALALALAVPAAWAAGFYTNGVPPTNLSYFAANGLPNGFTYSNELGGYEYIPADTNIANGTVPQTVSATTFQIAAIGAAISANTATATAGAATLNATYGLITSEAITTPVGASYTLTLTNSTVTTASKVQAAAYLGIGTAGALQLVSVTPATGSAIVVVKNVGTAALNSAIKIAFQVQ